MIIEPTLDTMEAGKKATLVNISKYAEKWNVTRDAVYERIKEGKVTVYELAEDPGKPYLNIDEDPQVRSYTKE